jgi:hypothetical protein
MHTCESGSIAVGARPVGEEGFAELASLLLELFRGINLIGDFLPFACVFPEVVAIHVSMSVTTKRKSHSI